MVCALPLASVTSAPHSASFPGNVMSPKLAPPGISNFAVQPSETRTTIASSGAPGAALRRYTALTLPPFAPRARRLLASPA